MKYPPSLNAMIEALTCLPGVGKKSAQRMAFHMLERDRKGASLLSETIARAMDALGHCSMCRNFAEDALCPVCADEKRDRSTLCIVESPSDVVAIEQSGGFNGRYFILMGHLSPIDGIGPEDIGLDILARQLENETINEVIVATNPTVEGEATAYFIGELARSRGITASRIAHGVPVGGELEYVDQTTLSHSIKGRTPLK